MSRKDNDSLEDFFRKATQHPDLQFNEDDWSKMEKKLDEHFGKPVLPVWRSHGRIISLITVAAALGVLTLLLWPSQGDDLNNLTQNTPPMPETSLTPSENNTQEPLRTADAEKDNVAETQAGTAKLLPQQAVESREAENSSITGSVPDKHAQKEIPSHPARPVGEDVMVNTIETGKLQPESGVAMQGSSGFNQEQPDPKEALNAGDGDDPSGMVQEGSDQLVDSVSAVITADALDTVGTVEAESRKATDKALGSGRFGISIIAAPDFSMTTKGGAMGPGEAVGIMLHYQVFNRWGITAGALHNTKKYWGRGNEYHPPSGYWNALTNGVVPDRVDGTCAMYEIPVSVTFDVVRTRRSRLFASAGLSSYIMQNEDYYYKFDTPNPGAVNGWSGDKPSTLWFGIGTLSVGYDFRATRSLSFGVEPYFKVPLEGIGWADIDLYSTGLMFAARYHFMKNGNKHPPPSQGP